MEMTIKDRFQRIRDYIDSQNIVDTLETYFSEDELIEFCEYLEDEFDVDISAEDDYLSDDDY